MINTNGAAPLFWYIYRPAPRNARDVDGGFNIALYPDHTLVYNRYNQANQIVDQSVFQLPPEVTATYLTILQSQAWWMGEMPLNIRVNGKAQYSCMFGFAGHPLFICDEINSLVLKPFNSQRGMYARRLRMMLESIAEMLYGFGIGLTVESFVWDWRVIQPINPTQNMQMVQPTSEQMPGAEDQEELYGVAQ